MSNTDFMSIVHWWFFIFLIGIVFLPLCLNLFQGFADRGYIFAKTLGIALLTYVIFIFGTLHIVPFTRIASILFLIVFFLLNYGVGFEKRKLTFGIKRPVITAIRKRWKLFLLEEILFFSGIFFWSLIRGFSPDIHGLEKFMDYGFMNSLLRSSFFPAKDMWLTPFPINYYYFGHLVTAVLIRLSEIPQFIAYNLMLATVFSLCFGSAFSLGSTLYTWAAQKGVSRGRLILAGLLTAFLITFGGNLHTVYTLFKPYANDSPVPPWQLQFSPSTFPNSYWYPNATRFIHNTIHEFPIYSWVVADLHGHVLDIPFVLLTIAFLFSLFTRLVSKHEVAGDSLSELIKYWREDAGHLLIVGLLLAIMYMTNAWDGLIYLLLALFVFLTSIALKRWHLHKRFGDKIFDLINHVTVPAVILIVSFVLFTLPFSLFFKPFVSGIGILCAPKVLTNIGKIGPFLFEADHCQRSPWWQLLILYGFFYFFVVSFLVFLRRTKTLFKSDMYILLLIGLATLLIIIPEFIYVKDIYPAHYRANTMFKLVFQSFMMLSICVGYIVYRIASSFRKARASWSKFGYILWLLVTLILFIPIFIYPYFAINSYYGNLSKFSGLNGITYLQNLYPTDYKAIQWLNTSIKGQPVILEAQGDSYTDFARVSANTGLPTILGWTVHEWLWRGSYDREGAHDKNTIYNVPAPRISEVQTLYETQDIEETKRLLKKYHVVYVFVGDKEYEKYPNLSEAKFKELGKVVYQNGNTRIYKINPL